MSKKVNFPKFIGFSLSARSFQAVRREARVRQVPTAKVARALFEFALQEYKKNPDIIFEV